MKKLLILSAILFTSVVSFGQANPYPAPNSQPAPFTMTGQMLNTSSTFIYEVLDTATDAQTLYLYTCKYDATTHLPVVYPVYGYGTISFIVKSLKISGTPAGTVSLEESFDGDQLCACARQVHFRHCLCGCQSDGRHVLQL